MIKTAALLLTALAAGPLFAQPLFNKAVSWVRLAGPPDNAIYTWSNGLFRSRDNGQTWVALHMREPGLEQPRVTNLLIDPGNPRTLYALTSAERSLLIRW